jgi:L-serine dehydratase
MKSKMTRDYSSFDIIGPIMVGPSSSHTAGAVRLGRMARILLGEVPVKALIQLHGSFWQTYKGHGTDLALVAGLLGLQTDDPGIKEAFQLAKENNLEFSFAPVELGDVHPNTVKMRVEGKDGYKLEMQGSSIGGASIVISEVNGFPVEIKGDYETLVTVHQDRPGVVAQVSGILAKYGVNIASMRVSRKKRGKLASMMIEIDQQVPACAIQEIKELSAMTSVRFMEKV